MDATNPCEDCGESCSHMDEYEFVRCCRCLGAFDDSLCNQCSARAEAYVTTVSFPSEAYDQLVNAACCPICSAPLKWGCGSKVGSIGTAHCQDGTTVSRRWPNLGTEPCLWAGTKIVRRADLEVCLVLPVSTDCFDYARPTAAGGPMSHDHELSHQVRKHFANGGPGDLCATFVEYDDAAAYCRTHSRLYPTALWSLTEPGGRCSVFIGGTVQLIRSSPLQKKAASAS